MRLVSKWCVCVCVCVGGGGYSEVRVHCKEGKYISVQTSFEQQCEENTLFTN